MKTGYNTPNTHQFVCCIDREILKRVNMAAHYPNSATTRGGPNPPPKKKKNLDGPPQLFSSKSRPENDRIHERSQDIYRIRVRQDEIFIRRSWYSVLPSLDATISCRIKKAVVGVTQLITALLSGVWLSPMVFQQS